MKQTYFKSKARWLKNVTLQKGVQLDSKTKFGGNNAVYQGSRVRSSFIGYGTYIANNSAVFRSDIGKYCAIGDNVSISLGLHPSKEYVSIHPAFFSIYKQAGFTYVNEQRFSEHNYLKDSAYCVKIGNDVWIGNNVLIFDGVTVGDGAIIGAGAIVTKSVEPYSIVLGAPAKHVRYRFTAEEIEKLLKLKWWDKDPEWLKANSLSFKNIKQFLNENEL
ncbi:CatB-related O-acetyltransferase [Mucilaginibacter ginsenosidivorax]|nr:CatB-related O-acetyltransferase [Mucilaginibacter ginsenosidivorax]